MGCDERPDDWAGPRTADTGTRRRLDELLSAVADRRRRDILYYLATTDVTDVETLATKLAAADEDAPEGDVPPAVIEEVEMTLVHTHLPKLVDARAVEFDQRSGAVRFRGLPPMLQEIVESCREIEAESEE